MTALTPAPSNIQTAPPSLPDLLGASPADLVDRWAETEPATADEARLRADRIRSGLPVYAQMRQEIADAYAHRDWVALGHASWPEYLAIEFGTELARLARDERREAVRDLRDQGLSTRQIATVTGAKRSTVHDDLKVSGIRTPEGEAPARVTGSDGKRYPASKPKSPGVAAPEPAEASSSSPAGPGGKPAAGGNAPEGESSTPSGAPEARGPAKWKPGEREAHEAEVLRLQDIRSAHRAAENIVTEFRTLVVTLVTGVRLGEAGLVTAEMIADLRKTLDLLEGEL